MAPRRVATRCMLAARRLAACAAIASSTTSGKQASTRSQPAARCACTRCADATGDAGRGHADVIADHRALKAQLIAQDALDPAMGITGRLVVHGRIDHVRHHHRLGVRRERFHKRTQIIAADLVQRTRIDRLRLMRIHRDRAMTREMLEHRRHAAQMHAAHVGLDQFAGNRPDRHGKHAYRSRRCRVPGRPPAQS